MDLYTRSMKENGITAPTPLYVASGLLTYMQPDGEGRSCLPPGAARSCRSLIARRCASRATGRVARGRLPRRLMASCRHSLATSAGSWRHGLTDMSGRRHRPPPAGMRRATALVSCSASCLVLSVCVRECRIPGHHCSQPQQGRRLWAHTHQRTALEPGADGRCVITAICNRTTALPIVSV